MDQNQSEAALGLLEALRKFGLSLQEKLPERRRDDDPTEEFIPARTPSQTTTTTTTTTCDNNNPSGVALSTSD